MSLAKLALNLIKDNCLARAFLE